MQELEWWQSQLKELKPWPAVHDLRAAILVRWCLSQWLKPCWRCAFRDAVLD